MPRDFNSVHGVSKDLTVGDVHVASTDWNRGRKGKRRRRMISTIGMRPTMVDAPIDVTAMANATVGKRDKITKEAAGYIDPATGSQKCAQCTMFLPDRGKCTLVKGAISAGAWCQHFSAPLGKGDLPAVEVKTLHGIPIAIETKAGSRRAEEATPLLADYGRIMGTLGGDGDQVDVLTGPELDSLKAYVVNEGNPDGQFHQVKVLLGFNKKKPAKKAYLSSQFPGRQLMNLVKTSVENVKNWLASGETTGPFQEPVEKKTLAPEEGRKLEPFARGLAKPPIPVMRHALSHIRADQSPRLLEALTHPDRLDKRKMRIGALTAIQDRIDPAKVKAMMEGEHDMAKRPVIARFGGRNFVVDGDHHVAARWLGGKSRVKVHFLDLTPRTEAMKRAEDVVALDVPLFIRLLEYSREEAKGDLILHRIAERVVHEYQERGPLTMTAYGAIVPEDVEKAFARLGIEKKEVRQLKLQPAVRKGNTWSAPLTVAKTDPDKQFIFGWASVSTINGELVLDKQDEQIESCELEAAAYDYVLEARDMGHMHTKKGVGNLIESMMFSKEKQQVLGIDLGLEAWWVGFRVSDADVWKAIKRGELPELSIGGVAIPVDID